MKRVARYFLVLLIFIALVLGAMKAVHWAMHPFRADDAEKLADQAIHKRGGQFKQLRFDDLGNERYKAVYRRGAKERIDVTVDNGVVTIVEGLPMGGVLDLDE